MSAAPDPRALAESLVGQRVKVTVREGFLRRAVWLGVMNRPGDQGFSIQLTDGIGGRAVFGYRDVWSLEVTK